MRRFQSCRGAPQRKCKTSMRHKILLIHHKPIKLNDLHFIKNMHTSRTNVSPTAARCHLGRTPPGRRPFLPPETYLRA